MAHSPASRPDPFEPRKPDPGSASQPAGTAEAPDRLLHHYLSMLSASGGGSLSAEVALDLVLNEIAERACQATHASGAAIALTRDGEMVCRATTGENSPDIGARLSASHGLSGACLRSGEWQCCNDTENDPRVDAEACRRLAVRSILVLPVWRVGERIGVFEIFSIRPDAFGERDIHILQNLSREISENVGSAENLQLAKPESPLVVDSATPENPPAFENAESIVTIEKIEQEEGKPPQKDFSTTALLVCVIVLALILGWIVGRGQWRRPTHKSVAPANETVQEQPQALNSDSPTTPATSPPMSGKSTSPPSASTAVPEDTVEDDGLVVTRNGKVIFRSSTQSSNEGRATTFQPAEQPTSKRPRLRISSEIAQEYLATKVEPEYPEQARRQQVQGPVVLDVWVGTDGTVRSVTPISGNPELQSAATQAVAQWRFHPFFHDGQPEEFTTRMTVDFRLP
jgi:TonB family protein